MRKTLTKWVLLIFVCAASLQAYAQGCAVHCDLMQGSTDGLAGTSSPADQEPADGTPPCTQAVLCEVAGSVTLSMPSTFDAIVSTGASSLSPLAAKFLDDRALSPLDRPPISS